MEPKLYDTSWAISVEMAHPKLALRLVGSVQDRNAMGLRPHGISCTSFLNRKDKRRCGLL